MYKGNCISACFFSFMYICHTSYDIFAVFGNVTLI